MFVYVDFGFALVVGCACLQVWVLCSLVAGFVDCCLVWVFDFCKFMYYGCLFIAFNCLWVRWQLVVVLI